MNYTVITGASAGIGRAAALAFAKRGHSLVLVARREDRLRELARQVAEIAPGVACEIRVCDLADPEACRRMYESLDGLALGAWINNAGVGVYGEVAGQDTEAIQRMLRVNVEALTLLSGLFVRDYRDTPGAQLINVSSAGGYTVVQNAVAYCASKFYVSAYTEGLALELQSSGAALRAKVLAPFLTQTEFAAVANSDEGFAYEQHYKRYHTSEEMAALLLQLYDSDAIVGRVSREDFSFTLAGPQCSHSAPSK